MRNAEQVRAAAAEAVAKASGYGSLAEVDAVQDGEPKWVREAAEAATSAVLHEVYWNLREHASGYRGTEGFRRSYEKWQANRDDPRAYQKHVIHEFYARGVESMAREIALLIGEPEHEIIDTRPYAGGGPDA